jgi:hypothetical protein
MLESDKLPDADETQSPFALQDTVIYAPTHLSARISSQGGLFTAHGKPDQIFDHPSLERWVIKLDCCIELSLTIQTYGVNEATIFRDLDSLARTLNRDYVRGFLSSFPD